MNRVINRVNKKLSLSNAALLLIIATLATQLLGFFRYRLVVANFANIDPRGTDAFFTAFQIPDFFFLTIAAGVLGVAFMPVLAEKLHAGDRKAIWNITSSLLNLMFIIMLFVALFIFIFAEPLIHHIV
jgi:putative peptidoglycan lipid II flippase